MNSYAYICIKLLNDTTDRLCNVTKHYVIKLGQFINVMYLFV